MSIPVAIPAGPVVEKAPTAPVITLNGPSRIVVAPGEVYEEQGAKMFDKTTSIDFRDLSADIVIAGTVGAAGSHDITYDGTDPEGNAAPTVTRTVIVEDVPVINITGANPMDVTVDTDYVEAGATITDVAQGDMSSKLQIDASEIDLGTIGEYNVYYNVTDAGNYSAKEVIRVVSVIA